MLSLFQYSVDKRQVASTYSKWRLWFLVVS